MSDVQLSIIIGKMTDERINKTDNPLLSFSAPGNAQSASVHYFQIFRMEALSRTGGLGSC